MELNALSYFKIAVTPAVEEFEKDQKSIRLGIQAAILLSHQVDYAAQENLPRDLRPVMEGRVRRLVAEIQKSCPEIEDLRSIANLAKHSQLAKPKKVSLVATASMISTPPGLFQAPFGHGSFAEAISVQVAFDSEEKKELFPIVKKVFDHFQKKYALT